MPVLESDSVGIALTQVSDQHLAGDLVLPAFRDLAVATSPSSAMSSMSSTSDRSSWQGNVLPVSSSVLMLLPPDKCHSEMFSRSVITRPDGLTEQSGAAAATPLLEESARPTSAA